MSDTKNKTWEKQSRSLREPLDIISASFEDSGLTKESLKFKTKGNFTELLHQNNLTLFVTREYENLVVAMNASKGKLEQTVLPLPHPSGLAVDRKNNSVFIAATRNPNQIIEFKPVKNSIHRIEKKGIEKLNNFLFPSRTKYYPGCYYFHDLAMINGVLHANSVGMNGIIKVDFEDPSKEDLIWWPKCTEKKGKPDTSGNFIQLNSIAAGKNLENSFFSASGDEISARRPGHLNYPVDKRGVIISGKTREVIARGLTRPHSARIYNNKIWIDNSGYGEFGYIEKEKFIPVVKLPGWTRGLCIVNDIAFIGVSRVIQKFKRYAPGIKEKDPVCGVYAVSIKSGEVLGSVLWDFGNQIFAIDYIDSRECFGFPYKKIRPSGENEKSFFYKYR